MTKVFEAIPWLGYDNKTGSLVDYHFYMPPLCVPFAFDLAAPWLARTSGGRMSSGAARDHVDQIIAKLNGSFLKAPGASIPLGGVVQAMVTAVWRSRAIRAPESHEADRHADTLA